MSAYRCRNHYSIHIRVAHLINRCRRVYPRLMYCNGGQASLIKISNHSHCRMRETLKVTGNLWPPISPTDYSKTQIRHSLHIPYHAQNYFMFYSFESPLVGMKFASTMFTDEES